MYPVPTVSVEKRMHLFIRVCILFVILIKSNLSEMNPNNTLIDFLRATGWKRLNIVSLDQRTVHKFTRLTEIYKELQICFIPYGNIKQIMPTLYLLTENDPVDIWNSVACVKPHQCVGLIDRNTWPKFKHHMEALNKSRAFYSLIRYPSGLSMYRTQTFRDQNMLVLNKITLVRADTRLVLRHDYNMDGATLTSISGDWRPYNRFFNCKHDGWKGCQQEGIIADVSQILAKQFNFSIVTNREPHENWGKDKCFGKTTLANWTEGQPFPNGVMGYLEHEMVDMTLMTFRRFLERDAKFGFSIPICTATRKIVFSFDKSTPLDYDMFLRPFARLSWSFVTLFALFFVVFVYIFNKLDTRSERRLSYQIILLTIWLMFVLLNAYYGGALTMFFSTVPSMPFNNLQDMVKLYPSWKLFIVGGDWTYLLDQKVPDEFIDRVLNNDQRQVKSFKSAIEKVLSEPGSYFCPTDIRLSAFASKLPMLKSRIMTHGDPMKEYKQILFPKNSPNIDMFDRGILKLRETGTITLILSEWVRRTPVDGTGHGETESLGIEKTLTSLIFLLVAYVMALGIWLCEKLLAALSSKISKLNFR